MKWAKRIVLFLAVNFLVITTLTIVTSLLGLPQRMHGDSYAALMVFCLVWGFGGALISLALSRIMAKWMMGVEVIDPGTPNAKARDLVQRVHHFARAAGLSTMPEVGIYDSPEINAFATGPSKNRSLVAVSSGLLQQMDSGSVDGVLAHEISHIANGDMVTMTLIQGVINAFVMFLARIIALAIDQALSSSRDNDSGSSGGRGGLGGFAFSITVMLLEWVFMILGSIVVMAFSRWREYRADAGGARLAGRDKMVAALRTLMAIRDRGADFMQPEDAHPALASFKISGHKRGGLLSLFSSHPDLEERIERLQRNIR